MEHAMTGQRSPLVWAYRLADTTATIADDKPTRSAISRQVMPLPQRFRIS